MTEEQKNELRWERRQLQRRMNVYIGQHGMQPPEWMKERVAEICKLLESE